MAAVPTTAHTPRLPVPVPAHHPVPRHLAEQTVSYSPGRNGPEWTSGVLAAGETGRGSVRGVGLVSNNTWGIVPSSSWSSSTREVDDGARRAAVPGRPTRAGGGASGRPAARSRGIVRVCVELWAAVVACATSPGHPCCIHAPRLRHALIHLPKSPSWRLWVRVLQRWTALLARSSPCSPSSSSRLPSACPSLSAPSTPPTPAPRRCPRSPGPLLHPHSLCTCSLPSARSTRALGAQCPTQPAARYPVGSPGASRTRLNHGSAPVLY